MTAIPRRPFGITGESVPALSMGCGPFSTATASAHIAAVRRAVDLGMDYVDTSPFYGNGESQEVLGRALAEIREPVFVATKVGHYEDRSQFRNVDTILAQVRENLRILGRDHVDLLQIHEADWRGWWSDAEPLDVCIRLDEALDFAGAPVMEALRTAREQGLCRFIGITGNTTVEIAHVLKHVEVDAMLVAYNYNLILRGALTHCVPVARECGAACIMAGPLYNARLAAVHREWLDEPPGWMTPDFRERYAALCEIQEESGIPMPELAIRYVMEEAGFCTVLTASITVGEVEQNHAAATAGFLPGDVRRRIDGIGLAGPDIQPWLFEFWKQM
jgi:aryl-alcohol dehydrogenase-like predicted oxidoreductase